MKKICLKQYRHIVIRDDTIRISDMERGTGRLKKILFKILSKDLSLLL